MDIKTTPSFQAIPAINDVSKISTRSEVSAIAVSSTAKTTDNETVNEAALDKAINKSNEILTQKSTGLEFSLDKDSGRTIVKLIDKRTDEILREYPSKQMLALAKDLEKFQGSLVSEKV